MAAFFLLKTYLSAAAAEQRRAPFGFVRSYSGHSRGRMTPIRCGAIYSSFFELVKPSPICPCCDNEQPMTLCSQPAGGRSRIRQLETGNMPNET
jgi:hypothetical protein